MTRRELLNTIQGLMDIAETAMPGSYFQTDKRVAAGREAVEALIKDIVGDTPSVERALER